MLVIFSIFLLAEAINSVGEFAELSFNNSPDGEPPNLPDSTSNSPIEIRLGEDRVPENTTCNIGCEGGQPYDMDIFEIMGRTGTAYLRTAVGEVYNRGWKSTNQNGAPYNGEYRDQANQFSASSEAHYFVIKPLAPLGGYIPTPKNVNQIVIDKSLIEYPSFHLFWGSATEESYEVSSTEFFFAASVLRDASCWYNETYLQVPSELKSKLKPLAEQVTGGYSSPYDKLKALESYLQMNYVYDMNYSRAPTDTDPVEWFLFHEKRGVCANFNSAFVLLARSIGISARLVGGYYVDPDADQQTVNSKQGHAWSEAPFVGVGWIRFDATASADSEVISIPDDGGSKGPAECETCEELFDEDSETLIDVNSIISPEGCCGNSSCELFMVLGQPRTGYLRTKVGESYNGYWVPESSKVMEVDEVIPSRDIQNYEEAVAHGFIVKPLLKIGGYIPTALYASEINYGYALNYYERHESFFSPQVSYDSYRVIYTDYLFSDTVLNSSDCEYNETYLQLPSDLSEKLRPLAEEVTGNYGTPYAKLKALEFYLQSNYVYDKNYTKAPSNIDPVEWFLFHERRGVCANFNSAFVLLARSIGLPARLVAGYSVSPNLEQQTVTCKNRHAWSEVPFNGIGWIRFDATAPEGDVIENLLPLKKPTKTEITSMDVIGVRGLSFNVQGTLMDLYDAPVDGVSVVVYLNEHQQQRPQPMAAVDQNEPVAAHPEHVVDGQRGDDEAEPEEGGRDHPVRECDRAEMAEDAGQHPGHDQVGDEGDDQRPGRRALAVMGADLFGGEAVRRHPWPSQQAVPDAAESPGGRRRHQNRPVVDAGEGHLRPPILHTAFHSSAVTGCTDSRVLLISTIALSFGDFFTSSMVTGFGSGCTALTSTTTHGSPGLAAGSG